MSCIFYAVFFFGCTVDVFFSQSCEKQSRQLLSVGCSEGVNLHIMTFCLTKSARVGFSASRGKHSYFLESGCTGAEQIKLRFTDLKLYTHARKHCQPEEGLYKEKNFYFEKQFSKIP